MAKSRARILYTNTLPGRLIILNKFGNECGIWMEKRLENADGDRSLIRVSLGSGEFFQIS